MSILKLVFIPFAIIYDLVMNIRNRLYDLNFKPSTSFDLPVIGVGNLAVGGTGKTPMVEYLIRLLSVSKNVATLSRGYGRKTKGFRLATPQDSATTIGDEPFQLYSKYNNHVNVAVGEERVLAIPLILNEHADTEIIIMDDSFQHRRVKPGFQILLTEYARPFYDDHVLPYGRLREGPEGATRADVIVVTKCPEQVDEEKMMAMRNAFLPYTRKPVFFSKIRYGEPTPVFNHTTVKPSQVVLISGIANHNGLEEYVRKNFTLHKHFAFRDHHVYTPGNLQSVVNYIEGQGLESVCILTTEKDKVKLNSEELQPYFVNYPLFYLPIEMEFIRNGKDFDTLVRTFVDGFQSEE
jgi:tetraacyldisaccharide 4'-kinase